MLLIITVLGVYTKGKIKLCIFVSLKSLRKHAIYTDTNA